MTVPGSHHADFRGLLLGWTACPAIPDNLSGVSGPRWISQKTLLVLFPKIASHGLCFACFQAAARQFSYLQRIVMARRHCRRAVMLRVELGSTSSRTRLCFESNQALLLVEPHFGKHTQHARQQRCHGMKHIESVCLKTEWPEGYMARSPSTRPSSRGRFSTAG